DAFFSRIHHLIRLWRKLGWSILDVDRMLAALGGADTTPDILHALAEAKQLIGDLNLTVQVAASFWGNIDVVGDDALYRKLFLNKAVREIDDVFTPAADGSVLTAEGLFIRDHIPAILAAFHISERDLAFIRTDAALDADNAPLTLTTV